MQRPESITRGSDAVLTTPAPSRLAALRPGDSVLVRDGVKETNIWQRVAELKEGNGGRLKLRVEGTSFFFDEALVISYASDTGEGVM